MAATKAPIADMRPTQLTLGLSEVEERAAKIGAMTPSEREAHLERKAIPHVLGPGKKIYIVDHHHLARALWSLKIPEAILGDRVADWSGLEPKAFWRMMESKGYCWPIDADGNRRPYAAIPASIADLTDNVWPHAGATSARHGVRGFGYAVSGIHVGRLFPHIHESAADRVAIRTRGRAGDETCAPVRGAGPAGLSGLTLGFARSAQATKEQTPIEDTSIAWDVPMLKVAQVRISSCDLDNPQTSALSEAVNRLSFSPWHATDDHRPVGNVMRARQAAYEASSALRGHSPEPTGLPLTGP